MSSLAKIAGGSRNGTELYHRHSRVSEYLQFRKVKAFWGKNISSYSFWFILVFVSLAVPFKIRQDPGSSGRRFRRRPVSLAGLAGEEETPVVEAEKKLLRAPTADTGTASAKWHQVIWGHLMWFVLWFAGGLDVFGKGVAFLTFCVCLWRTQDVFKMFRYYFLFKWTNIVVSTKACSPFKEAAWLISEWNRVLYTRLIIAQKADIPGLFETFDSSFQNAMSSLVSLWFACSRSFLDFIQRIPVLSRITVPPEPEEIDKKFQRVFKGWPPAELLGWLNFTLSPMCRNNYGNHAMCQFRMIINWLNTGKNIWKFIRIPK